jgi:hypothetical protein
VGRLWSELEPWEWRARLAEVHPELNEQVLVDVGWEDPGIAPQVRAQRAREDAVRVALHWYADEGRPQPEQPTRYLPVGAVAYRPVPRWDPFPPLEELMGSSEAGGLARRDPLPVPEVTNAVRRRLIEGLSWPQIESDVGLSHRKLSYVRKALEHGDLGWDLNRDGLILGPHTRNTPAGLMLPPR